MQFVQRFFDDRIKEMGVQVRFTKSTRSLRRKEAHWTPD